MSTLPPNSIATPPDLAPYARLSRSDLNGWRTFWNQVVVWSLRAWMSWEYGLHFYGGENVPKREGSFVAIANHTSYADPPLVSMACQPRPVSYMAKLELFKNPILRRVFRTLGVFAVNRTKVEKATIRSAKEVLSQGRWVLGLFPEGTRSADGEIQTLKKGAATFARMAQVGVLPIGISSASRPEPGPETETKPQKERRHYFVYIAPLVPYDPTLDTDALSDRIQEALHQAKAEADRLRDQAVAPK